VSALRRLVSDTQFDIRSITSEGDRDQERPISELGDKGLFVRALERALLDGAIDLAVHSLKDVPSDVETPGLTLAAFLPREDPRDCLISRDGRRLRELPASARIGTGSLRRRVQLLALRPDLAVTPIRGNVDTRLRKLHAGEYDTIVLAAAGLHRLDLAGAITEYLPASDFVPDAGQGILAVQARAGDPASEVARAVDDPSSRAAAEAERAAVRALGADCRSPAGVLAEMEANELYLRGMAASEDGSVVRRAEVRGSLERAGELGRALGEQLAGLLSEAGAG